MNGKVGLLPLAETHLDPKDQKNLQRNNEKVFRKTMNTGSPMVFLVLGIIIGITIYHFFINDEYNPDSYERVIFDADEWNDGVIIAVTKNDEFFGGDSVRFNCITTTSDFCIFGNDLLYTLYDVNMNIIFGDELPSDATSHTITLNEEPVRVSISGAGSEIMFRTF